MTPTRETFGNISTSSQVVFYVVAVASMAVFGYGIWRRFRLWRQGQSISLKQLATGTVSQIATKIGPGLRRLLVDGLGQQRVRGRGLPSWAHGLMFAGFMMLFLGTTLLEINHLAEMVSKNLGFHHGLYYIIYELTLDLFGLLFIVGTSLFFARRLWKPPSVGHRGTDWLVLILFLAIGITGYFVEALRIVWQQPTGIGAQCSPVGLWLSSAFRGWTEGQARAAHLTVWWVHALLVFGFIAAIPFTRLFHLIAGPINLFLSKTVLGQLKPITLEEAERDGRIGVSDIRHLTSQQLVSLDACMECGRCEDVCPAFATQKPLSPKRVIQDLKGVMEHLADATPDTPLSPHDVIKPETLWSCTACSACVFVCPVRIDQLTLILDMRRHLTSEGGLSGTAATALRRMQSSANPWGFPQSERANWVPESTSPPPN
ncbi:4Fe-4S dicluster domain-containing protein [Schlesneria paludicola]|uniref:4Fe-4S dicluster domain-containing protein n=1 Tax=Schlesneria paludicola TaxID=360056 RepID=UPI00029AF278|nr:4Fe-4S dicluster domain-containing protein [Schlesneria paludicola]